jgi:UDP-2-acetamido-3-amino-2,3-dideoxy-glucuronate N-acetyltransferase
VADDYFVHPSSYVDDDAEIGAGTKIWFFCHVQGGAKVGEGCILGQNVNLDRNVILGDGVKIQNNVSVYNGVIIGDGAFLGPSCVFTNVINPRSFIERKTEFRPTLVGKGASIGANATIVCGNNLGDYSMIGAGAVVTKDVPAYALMVGMPAFRLGWICRCGIRLPAGSEPTCAACGDRYREDGETLTPLDPHEGL